MGAGFPILCRTYKTDVGLYRDKTGTGFICLGGVNGSSYGLDVIAVLHRKGLKPESLHALLHILHKRQSLAALNGNIVGIVKHNQLSQPQSVCQGKAFRGNTKSTVLAADVPTSIPTR